MKFAIVSVGNELLRGDIVNDNAKYIAQKLAALGHSVERIVVVPDRVDDIVEELRRLLKYDFIFVTGGLGATHDDVTAEAIAKALNRSLVLDEKAVKQVKRWTDKKEVVEKVAKIPAESEVIQNDVGVAPAFITGKIAALPGVPAEMRDTFEKIVKRFEKLEVYEEDVIVEGKEEDFLEKLNSVVRKFPDVEIGSYPKPGYVVLKFRGKKERVLEAKREFLS
ncbi:molybdenum cofactor synthesis domain protein [Ferroglobus placidus DSM 10642]|uniref:Molybdenum cofactor synthesis domain protein n=1 Tax=Ferroglobus placidus (strain DSM 10642 / AEDII12DO) TaxID=589924 RepID=D3RY54_FERPA|nr:molybdopterin-binding protein [Ferroglobus placidus]ADC65417.1 molybdenum cofactor synthesis domain protein [Ferroglobus placidus DSM 10642]